MEKDLKIVLSAKEVLKDPTSALFKCNALIHTHKAHIFAGLKGSTMSVGEFRGSVTALDSNYVSLKSKDGVEKSINLTPGRLSQLLDETSRKKGIGSLPP